MKKSIKMLLFGKEHECRTAVEAFKAMDALMGYDYEHHIVDDLEEFEQALVDRDPSLLLVLADGAEGMECVYRSRERRPLLPVFWFSDDRDFGIQSYRLGCAYFSTKPVTHEKLTHAINRCDHIGIRYEAR